MFLRTLILLIALFHAFSLARASDSGWVIDERSGCVKSSAFDLANLSDILRREESIVCNKLTFMQYHQDRLSVEYWAGEYADSVYRLRLNFLIDAIEVRDIGKRSVVFPSEEHADDSLVVGPKRRQESRNAPNPPSLSVLSGYTLIQGTED